jgi:hypothetical protein
VRAARNLNRTAGFVSGNRGAVRELSTGVHDERAWPENVTAGLDQTPIPEVPWDLPESGLEGGAAMVLPWFDAQEDPVARTGMYASMDPTYPQQDIGGKSIVGAYEAAVRTQGPVYQWGHEVSGGLHGDQAEGRIMRFPANVPSRHDPMSDPVWQGDYRDELASAITNNAQGYTTESEYTASLLSYGGTD